MSPLLADLVAALDQGSLKVVDLTMRLSPATPVIGLPPMAKFDPPFPNHSIMQGAGKVGLASLCNLDQLPPTGAVVVAAPLKIAQGSGSPVRTIAIIPAETR
jgi:kynurenine formamidase